jgi:hypothetical protein
MEVLQGHTLSLFPGTRLTYALFWGLKTMGNFVEEALAGGGVHRIFTSTVWLPNFFSYSKIFKLFLHYSSLLLVYSSLFSLFHCCPVLFFVSCLPMTLLHSPGIFPTLFLRTTPGSRHSYFCFLFSLARHFTQNSYSELNFYSKIIYSYFNTIIYHFTPSTWYCFFLSVLVDRRLVFSGGFSSSQQVTSRGFECATPASALEYIYSFRKHILSNTSISGTSRRVAR